MATTVTSKGQVTIPKPVRDYLGIAARQPGGISSHRRRRHGDRKGRRAAAAKPVCEGASGSAGPGLSTDETDGHHARRLAGVTLVDSNVLLDIFHADGEAWCGLVARTARGSGSRLVRLLINDVIYAENVDHAILLIEDVDAMLRRMLDIDVDTDPPHPHFFSRARLTLRYRNAGGLRTGVLADFFIGAHAAVEQRPLLTRDARRYRTYFPTVELITPSESGG